VDRKEGQKVSVGPEVSVPVGIMRRTAIHSICACRALDISAQVQVGVRLC
jgi:hypothetical protein